MTVKTVSAPCLDPDETFKGVNIVEHRFQYRRCPVCGEMYMTPVFIGKTEHIRSPTQTQASTAR